MTKDVIAAILERRCVRNFEATPVPSATIGRILEAAQHAPSAGNIQPWEFYVVLRQEFRNKLAEAAFNQNSIMEAPVVIAVCANPGLSGQRYGVRGTELYYLQDTAAAVQNILLAADGYGLGSCWVGAFDEQKVAQTLNLPGSLRPIAMVPLGYAERPQEVPARRDLNEIVHILE